jgi:hypothetical protein
MTSIGASNHGNPAGIIVLTQKGTTSKGMEANKNVDKLLSLGRRISGTFAYQCSGVLKEYHFLHEICVSSVFQHRQLLLDSF